jgi:signal transduction histidine kinase
MKKRYFLGCLLLTLTVKVFAQTGHVFYLNKLPKNDTLLNGWKFHAGDNGQWADPAFDDSKWQAIDPGQDITTFSQLNNIGTGWLRLHIKTDTAIANQQLFAWVAQYLASEVYLDGKLIKRYGYIGDKPANTIAITPVRKPFKLKLKGGIEEVIAVRLGYQSGVLYTSPLYTTLPAFSIYINGPAELISYDDFLKTTQKLLIINAIATGIFLIFCFVHLVYFLFNRSQKFNLYYSAYCFCIFCIYATNIFIYDQDHTENISAQMGIYFFGGLCFCGAFLFFVLVVYELFGYQKRLIFKVLIVLSCATVASVFLGDIISGLIVSIVFPVICMLEASRVCILAAQNGKKHAFAILVFIVLFAILYVWGGSLDQTSLLATLINYFVFLALPIAMSVYLGIKTAVTNQHLKTMLIEVQILSEQNILKEQEKQQILADQNTLLETQVTERTAELSVSINHLKQTQTQLIQAEKMASLGELTAGIAHEIQNPLNFVNNFSEVNKEMLEELKAESQKPKAERDEQLEAELINDLIQNEEKINHHGKRADAIVKGMLEHSRASTGQKEPTDINALADEYLRLAYHGLRAKDKAFNADLVTNFDQSLPKVNLIPQDIGRVLLNLFNNAFYAVKEKQKTADVNYKPTVEVSTFSPPSGGWGVSVRDNGNGIPEAIKDKIMQPFFTTKPTGEGTGLGLSLSYDIVVKGHGGSIKVESVEGEGSEFIIQLPIIA